MLLVVLQIQQNVTPVLEDIHLIAQHLPVNQLLPVPMEFVISVRSVMFLMEVNALNVIQTVQDAQPPIKTHVQVVTTVNI